MDRLTASLLLEALATEPCREQRRSGWVLAPCPLAPWLHAGGEDRHPSFGISDKPGARSRYNCFSCGAHGTVMDLVQSVYAHCDGTTPEGYNFTRAFELAGNELDPTQIEFDMEGFAAASDTKPETIAWDDAWLNQFGPLDGAALAYLKARRFEVEDLQGIELFYDAKRKRILFVIRDWKGRLVGCHSRTIVAGEKPPYLGYKYHEADDNPFHEDGIWNALPWLGEYTCDPGGVVVLAEGPMDWLRVKSVYPHALCGLSVGLSAWKIKRLAKCSAIVTLFDVGVGGGLARKRIKEYLSDVPVTHLIPPEEYGDAGAMPRAAVRYLLEDHVPLGHK